MLLLSKESEQLASVTLSGGKGEPMSARVQVGEAVISSPDLDVSIGKAEGGLEVRVRVPGAVNFKVLLEKEDVKALKGLMNKEALGFFMKALF